MGRTSSEWGRKPPLPETHYVDSLVYTDEEIFEEEKEKIFARTWMIACHESDVPESNDYRTYRHPAGVNLVVVRGEDEEIRSFYNVCPHRGNTILYDPSGNAKRMTCIFHTWSFDYLGNCVGIPRDKAGYCSDDGCSISRDDLGLREVKTQVAYGGFVYVNLDDDCGPLEDHIGIALDSMLEEIDTEPLEVFSYHQAVIDTNYKLWHDTNSEFYHDYLHIHNRLTSMKQEGYFDRKMIPFANGHAEVGSHQVHYEAYEGGGKSREEAGFPGMEGNPWYMVDLFPGYTYNLRASVLRVDSQIPLGPNKTTIEYRSLGLKSDTEEQRRQRIEDNNVIWGPFGRNLHEDLLAASGQGRAIPNGSRYLLHAREEDSTIHDEVGMHHFYDEWSKRMGRSASDPLAKTATEKPARV
jgi:methanesulfonate monooxygenase subunit alpha